jgi:FKBP-type peptidyl-prolyl cis-trans isomerase 2
MRRCQLGDRVTVQYVQRFQDGQVRSSRTLGREPLELTVGTEHRSVPGLGMGLLGLVEGQAVEFDVPAERAYGLPDPDRIKRVTRARFATGTEVTPGSRARMRLRRGGTRSVRVLELLGDVVVVDLNHPRAGQWVHLEVELVTILEAAPAAD